MAKRAARPPVGLGWVVSWPLMLVFAAMVFLTAEEVLRPATDTPQPIGGPNWETRLQERLLLVTSALQGSGLNLPAPIEEQKGSGSLRWTHRHYDVDIPRTEQQQAEAVIQTLHDVDPGVTITSEATFDGTEVQVGLDGLLTHTLRFHWREKVSRPQVAVVIGSLGDDLRIARELVELDAPVALGVRPFRPFSKEVAELGHLFRREVLVHLAGSDRAEGAVSNTPSQRGGEGTSDIATALASVPHAVGVASGTGRVGEAAAGESGLMEELQRRGWFYIGTEAVVHSSEGGETPPVVTASALVLEPDPEPAAIARQLAILESRARDEGAAIAIGHADQATLRALRSTLNDWRDTDIDVIPVSALAKRVSLSVR